MVLETETTDVVGVTGEGQEIRKMTERTESRKRGL